MIALPWHLEKEKCNRPRPSVESGYGKAMLGSILLATVRGVPIKVHVTAFLLLPWIFNAMEGVEQPAAWALGFSVLFVVMLLGSVALHELGHTVVAQRYHMTVQDIILTPIGGVARLRGEVDNPRHEIRIALAGPYVSLFLALTGLLLSHQAYVLDWMIAGGLLSIFAYLNGMLFFFNLLPSFPMDGGRVLRAVLAQRKGMLEATRIAAGLGRSIALIFIVTGLATRRIPLAIIGFFILWAAGAEYRMMKLKTLQEQMLGSGVPGGAAASGTLQDVAVSPPPYAVKPEKTLKVPLQGFWGDLLITARDLIQEIFRISR